PWMQFRHDVLRHDCGIGHHPTPGFVGRLRAKNVNAGEIAIVSDWSRDYSFPRAQERLYIINMLLMNSRGSIRGGRPLWTPLQNRHLKLNKLRFRFGWRLLILRHHGSRTDGKDNQEKECFAHKARISPIDHISPIFLVRKQQDSNTGRALCVQASERLFFALHPSRGFLRPNSPFRSPKSESVILEVETLCE